MESLSSCAWHVAVFINKPTMKSAMAARGTPGNEEKLRRNEDGALWWGLQFARIATFRPEREREREPATETLLVPCFSFLFSFFARRSVATNPGCRLLRLAAGMRRNSAEAASDEINFI